MQQGELWAVTVVALTVDRCANRSSCTSSRPTRKSRDHCSHSSKSASKNRADRWQQKNLVNTTSAAIKAQLHEELHKFYHCSGATCP